MKNEKGKQIEIPNPFMEALFFARLVFELSPTYASIIAHMSPLGHGVFAHSVFVSAGCRPDLRDFRLVLGTPWSVGQICHLQHESVHQQ